MTLAITDIPPFISQHEHIRSYAEIQEIMQSRDFIQGTSPERDLFFGQSLVMIDGKEHLERKKLFSTLFSRGAMVHYETQLLEPVISRVMAELSAHRGADGLARTDLVPMVRIMLHRISAKVVGVDGVDTPERTERFRVMIASLSDAAAGQWAVGDRDELMKEGLAARKVLIDEFLRPSLEHRRALVRQFKAGDLQQGDLPKDVLTLICLHDKDGPGDPDHDAYVWRECTLFISASTQTTTHSLPHIVWHISRWIEAHPEDARKVNDAAFLRLAVGESLRLHQTAPVKTRIAARDVTLSTGRTIEKGRKVALFAPDANREPALYGQDATEFNPYREIPVGVQPWGLTFGAGAHNCLGRSLVTGMFNKPDETTGTEGTIVKMLKVLYAHGLELDPNDPPKRTAVSYHDAYASMPIILRKL
jgi:cytochrome P450